MQSSSVSSVKSAIFALTTVLQTKYLHNVDMVNSILLVSKGGIGTFLMCTQSTIWLDYVYYVFNKKQFHSL